MPIAADPSADAARSKPSLAPLTDLLKNDLAEVNRLILENMQSPVALIPQLAGHIVASGGKRLRPLLTLAAARLCGYSGTRQCGLATAVEFIHTATLLHDDVVDESALRRGQDSANALWGNQASVLVGDFLFSRAFELMVADGSLEVLQILSHASSVIAEGEVLQLITTNDLKTTEADYLEVIGGKTAKLFAAAAEVGAIVAGRTAEDVDAMRSFGMDLGIAFQLVDDMLDYSAKQAELGKTVGDDFREGKITLPVILAYARGSVEERAFWERTVERLEQTSEDLSMAQRLMRDHGTLQDTLTAATRHIEEARGNLHRFAACPIRDALDETLDFCLSRAY